ncbi:hypothetical protein C4K04_2684 [Pseudomonas chlororaphis]|uniref:Uncharacterized protein n=1 Tax=Pseudomonas chlororaphis TaxID=587753 RepID=A0A3G7TQ45_9PSED|nr:hypothetical protein C4K04_2684 [Pseudomonas chlororaphis]
MTPEMSVATMVDTPSKNSELDPVTPPRAIHATTTNPMTTVKINSSNCSRFRLKELMLIFWTKR